MKLFFYQEKQTSQTRPYCSCDLDLYPMTLTYELDLYHLKV